jgi:subtilisin family serine protease
VTQNDAPWGISRISSPEPYGTTYTYDASAGQGTCIYIIDGGVDVDNPDFESRTSSSSLPAFLLLTVLQVRAFSSTPPGKASPRTCVVTGLM